MSSSASETVTEEVTQVAVDRRAVLESGQQVFDNVIVDSSDAVMKDMVAKFEASFRTLVGGSTVNIFEAYDLTRDMLKAADENALKIENMGYRVLQSTESTLREAMDQGALTVEVVQEVAEKSIELAGDTTKQALSIVEKSEGGFNAETVMTLSAIMAVVALGAIYLAASEG